MAMDQAQAQAQAAQEPQEAQGGAQGAVEGMIVQVDQALTKLSQVFENQVPEAAQALAALNEQYRKIIEAVYAQAQGGQEPQQQRQATQYGSPEQGGRPERSQSAM